MDSALPKLRVLRVIHSVNPAGGGPIQGILSITPSLEDLGVETEILCLDPADAPWLRKFPLRVHAIGPGLRGYGYTPRFKQWFRDCATPFDAVLIHGLWLYVSFGTWSALRPSRADRNPPPYFVFPHGMLDPWFQETRPFKAMRNTVYWKLMEHRVIRDAEAVLFTSEEERRRARIPFAPYRCREEVVAYGAAPPLGDPELQKCLFFEAFPELKGKRLLLFLSRLHEKKGIDLLISAFARVRASSNADLHLVLAGPCADSSYLQAVRELAAASLAKSPRGSSNELPSITWTGMLDGDLKWGAFRAAEAFILPSHQENFGIAVAEALACGVPVLISDKVNTWREILEDRAGLVEADDLDGTIRLLEGWLSMEAPLRGAMRLAALQCFTSRFEIRHAARDLNSLLRNAALSLCEDSGIPRQAGTHASAGK